MLGNVNEWCAGPPEGPWGGPDRRALRGGCVLSKETGVRCASRYATELTTTRLTGIPNIITGFRVALDIDEYRQLAAKSGAQR
jgi:formylglycine-generating enzyme required for sulfatase activity